MCFTPQIYSPNKNSNICTEIQLNDRLITNNELKEFFINIPKRIELIELADDVSDNLDAFALVNDVEQCKQDITEANNAIELMNDNIDEINAKLGGTHISGTITENLKQVWDTLFAGDNLIDYVIGIEDTALEMKNIELPKIMDSIDDNESNINMNTESIDELKRRVLALENLCTQIEVNTAKIEVATALVNSMEAQLEQIRSEVNNTLSSFNNKISVLENRVEALEYIYKE